MKSFRFGLMPQLLAGFAAMSIVFAANRVNPLFALKEILFRSFGSPYGLKETVTKAIPLILIGSGLTLAFRARFWNIGAESQLLLGAMAATWVSNIGFGMAPSFTKISVS